MSTTPASSPKRWPLLVLLVVLTTGGVTWKRWMPPVQRWVSQTTSGFRSANTSADGHNQETADSPAGHDHSVHAGHSDATSLELSEQALRNIGLSSDTIQPIRLQTFQRSITVPAVVVERPGQTRVQVATPMTGVITQVHAVQGEAVEPGSLLFQIRLTHEDLVQAQTEFLRTLGELDVERREIERLTSVTETGAIAGKQLLERKYSRDKLTALLRAQKEALRLHGLSEQQVARIGEDRRLLRELQVFAPTHDHDQPDELKLTQQPWIRTSLVSRARSVTTTADHKAPLILQSLDVHKGQSVDAGETLCVLADYEQLFIEGLAFEQDIADLRTTSAAGWTVDAIFARPGADSEVRSGLEIAYLSNRVDEESRTLRFYVGLPNTVTKKQLTEDHRYIEWKYLPGQRLQVRVPVEEWGDQIVLPVDAVAQEGSESFVFQQNGSHFDRMPVHVRYRDQYSAVIDNDGSLFPGDVVAMKGAHQMLIDLKNKSGGGVDPHAGHNH